MSFEKVLERPEKVRRIDSKHRGAEAATVVERNDQEIRILFFQTVDQVNLRADRQFGSSTNLTHPLDDQFRQTNVVRKLRDFESNLALRMRPGHECRDGVART